MINDGRNLKFKDSPDMVCLQLDEAVLHDIVNTHPVMTDVQFTSFKNSIESKGQMEAVLLYRGKIVDGRHRYKALKELNADVIYATRLPNNMKLEDTQELAEASENRRHQTPTQLAIKGYKYWKDKGCTQKEAADSVGCSMANLKHVSKLDKLGRNDVIDLLWRGYKVDISDNGAYKKPSDSLLAIVKKFDRDIAVMDSNQTSGELTAEDYVKIDGVVAITSGWTDKEKKVLIAKLYKSMEN